MESLWLCSLSSNRVKCSPSQWRNGMRQWRRRELSISPTMWSCSGAWVAFILRVSVDHCAVTKCPQVAVDA